MFYSKKDLGSTSTQDDPLLRREGGREGQGLIHHKGRRDKIKAPSWRRDSKALDSGEGMGVCA